MSALTFLSSAGCLFCLFSLQPYPVPFSIKRPTNIAQWSEYCTQWSKCANMLQEKPASLQDTRCLKLSTDTTVTNRLQRCIWKSRLCRRNGANTGNTHGTYSVMLFSHKQWFSGFLCGTWVFQQEKGKVILNFLFLLSKKKKKFYWCIA